MHCEKLLHSYCDFVGKSKILERDTKDQYGQVNLVSLLLVFF